MAETESNFTILITDDLTCVGNLSDPDSATNQESRHIDTLAGASWFSSSQPISTQQAASQVSPSMSQTVEEMENR
jgi:hypothetical protein